MLSRSRNRGLVLYFAFLTFFVCLSNNSIGDIAIDDKVGVAIKNIVDAHESIQDQIEELDFQSSFIEGEKKRLEVVKNDLKKIFPIVQNNVNNEARSIFRGLKEIGYEEKKIFWEDGFKKKTRHKRSLISFVGVIAGLALGALGGVIAYSTFSNKRRKGGCEQDYLVKIESYLNNKSD